MVTSETAFAPAATSAAAGQGTAAARFKVWVDAPQAFSTQTVHAIRHNFQDHPLMQMPELAKLAKALAPTRQCRFLAPGTQQDSAFDHGDADAHGRSLDEVFRRIEEPGSWIALYNVETHPPYREFLKEVTDSVRHLVDREEPGMFNVGGFVFISAPPSVTPFHIDRENNFWLQMRGRKIMNVWDPTDTAVVPDAVRETFIVYAGLDDVRLKEGFRERSHEFDVAAGDGVYFPSTSPHMTHSETGWTQPGDGVSVSIGVVFYTSVTRRRANVHAWNLFLRNRGWTPAPPGRSELLDRLKYPLGKALIWFKQTFRGHKTRVGF